MLRRLAEATSLTCLQGGNLENKHRTKDLWIKWSYCKVCRGVTLQHTNYCTLSHMGILCARWGCSSARHLSCCNSLLLPKGAVPFFRPCFPTFSPALQAVWSHPLHCIALALIWPLSESVEFVKPTKNCWLFCGVGLLLAQWAESARSAVRGAAVSPLRGHWRRVG